MAERKDDTIRAHWKCFLACGIMTLSPFQYGVDFGLIGGLQAMPGFLIIYGYRSDETAIGWNISRERQQLISSLMTLGAFLSSMTAGFWAARLGRKPCIWICCVLCVISNIIMMATENIIALYIGRLLIGLANGGFMTFSQLYIQESSPAKYRGLFLTAFQFFVSFGTLIGTVVDWATAPLPGKEAYLIPLGMIYIVPVILTIGMLFIPESPRWLMLRGFDEQGRKALAWMRPTELDVDREAAEIRSAIDKERLMGSEVGVLDMFRNPIDRRRTALAVGGVTLQAASGAMFIIAYKAYFFTMAGVQNPFGMTCVLSAVGLAAILFNACIVVRYGRRRVLLMTGLLICGVLQLIVAVTYGRNPEAIVTGRVLIALSCLYMFSYNGFISSYAWLSGGELPSQRLRTYAFGLAAAVGFFGAWLTTFTAPYFINPEALNWGPRYGYIWFPSCIIGAVWVYIFLPEVKGRSLEEIDELFALRLPARRFRKHELPELGGAEKMDDRPSFEQS